MKNYALISLYHKEGLADLVKLLEGKGFSLLATGNTYRQIKEMGHEVTEVSDLTGEPERFGGRVKTLNHRIHGGLLFRPGKDESEWNEGYRIGCVACNFYPFEEKSKECQNILELMEWVDIGGPTMVRAAAKNHPVVWVLTRPEQYVEWAQAKASEENSLREKFALEAFMLVESLDRQIFQEFYRRTPLVQNTGSLRYGENPHQKGNFYPRADRALTVLGAMSYNNFRDAEAALKVISPFKGPAVSVIKHQTPCGVAAANEWSQSAQVFHWAWEGDDVSRFGGVLAFNFCPDEKTTEILEKKFIEVIVLPHNQDNLNWARALHQKKEKLRFVLVDEKVFGAPATHSEVYEGALGRIEQDADYLVNESSLISQFGQWVGACSKSNAMVLVGEESGVFFLAGAGQGQPNRVDALEKLALPRAQKFCERLNKKLSDLVCFSDGFLPFRDSLDVLAKFGVREIYQPGGSKQDEVTMAAAKELDIKMHMTGERHFWH